MKRRRSHVAPPGAIHVIGGSLRGSRLAVPVRPGLRPTPQRLRQTLFDWLAPVITGARVLDVFAGSGALGIEALSRGAGSAVFFERDSLQAQAIAADLARLHQDRAEVRCIDSLQALAGDTPVPFDIALLDPPFDQVLWAPATALLAKNGWLAPHAWVYVEAARDTVWSPPVEWAVHRQREAGAVCGTLFRVEAQKG